MICGSPRRLEHLWGINVHGIDACKVCGVGSSMETREHECPVRLRSILDALGNPQEAVHLTLGTTPENITNGVNKIACIKTLRGSLRDKESRSLKVTKTLVDAMWEGQQVEVVITLGDLDRVLAEFAKQDVQVIKVVYQTPSLSVNAERVLGALRGRPELYKEISGYFIGGYVRGCQR
jgi:hypothetical protein